MDVLDGSASNNLSIIPCNGFISEQQQRKALFPLESDLVVVRLAVRDATGKDILLLTMELMSLDNNIMEKVLVRTPSQPRPISNTFFLAYLLYYQK